MNKKFSKLLLTSASAVALLAAYPSVAQNANEALGLDLPSITAEAATTAGNAFVKRVMDLPNVSTIGSKTPEEIEDHGRDMRSIRRAYDRLSAADKDATVEKWEGYLYQKERAIGNVFVDIIMDLHTIAEIEEFDTADFAAEQKAARRARNQYEDLSQVAKENASVVKWLEYLDQKEQPLGITFVNLVGEVPNVSTLEGLTEEELEVANKSIAAAEASYDKLSDAAKADALVEKWLGYLADKKEAIVEELSVGSVKAINSTTLELTGTALQELKVEDLTVSNNTVVSVSANVDGKTANVVLGTQLVDQEEVTVTYDEKEYKFTFKLVASTIGVKEATYDDDTKNQYVKIVSGGKELLASDLIAAGYDVKFEAYDNRQGTTAAVGFFKDDTTGLLADDLTPNYGGVATAGTPVYVVVTATKGSEVLTSSLQKITIKNIDLASDAIESTKMVVGTNVFSQTSNTLVVGETANITEIKVKVGAETETIDNTDNLYNVKSLNPAVVAVDATTGELTAITPGTATVVVSYGGATKNLTLTVKNEARELKNVVVQDAAGKTLSSKVLAKDSLAATNADKTVYVKPVDQYGDIYDVVGNGALTDLAVVSSDNNVVIEDTFLDAAPTNGIYELLLNPVAAGTGYLTFTYEGFKVSGNPFKVTVSDNATISTYKLEITSASDSHDLELNLADLGDRALELQLVGYNAQGLAIAPDLTVDTAAVEVAQSAKVLDTVTAAAGVITVPVGDKTGSATITVTLDGKKYSATVKVVNTPVEVKSVAFKSIASPSYAKDLTYSDALTATVSANDPVLSGLTLTKASSQPVRLETSSGQIYLDKNADGSYDPATETPLGFLVMTYVDADGNVIDITDVGVGHSVAAGDEGTLIYKVVKEDNTTVVATTTVNIDLN